MIMRLIKQIRNLLLNDTFILCLILLNALIIFAQGFSLAPLTKKIFLVSDNLITLIFLFEIIAKVVKYKLVEFIKSGWNIFDTVLILLALPSLFYWIFKNGTTHLDYLLVLRVLRVFKFFRFIRFFPNIDELIAGIQRALKASVIVILGFFVYNFIISVIACFFYKNIAPEYFGNPLTSLYTIFKIFTVEGWYEIPDFIASRSNETVAILTKLFFILILITGGIFGLSLVNSIFVDAMVSDNNEELEKKVESLEKKIDTLLNK